MFGIVCGLMLPGALSLLPAAYELDFRPLPAANNAQVYKFTVTIELASGKRLPIPIVIGESGDPKTAAIIVAGQFMDPLWKWKQKDDDLLITVYSFGKDVVKKVTVTGKGPKPAVRRVLLLPPDKKPENK